MQYCRRRRKFVPCRVKKCVTKKGVYNAAIGGKISIFANICWTKTLYRGFSKGGNHKENARGEGLENSAGGGVFIVRPSTWAPMYCIFFWQCPSFGNVASPFIFGYVTSLFFDDVTSCTLQIIFGDVTSAHWTKYVLVLNCANANWKHAGDTLITFGIISPHVQDNRNVVKWRPQK